MIIINVTDLTTSLEQTKKDLEELNEFGVVFEELDNNFFQAEASMHIDNNALIQNQLLISEIRE